MGDRVLTELLRRHAQLHRVPGAAVGVSTRGVAVTAYYGVADVRTAQPVTAAAKFAIGSLTKTMVASALAILDAEGRLSLDDPVAAHVPELRSSAWADNVTARDLMANRSPVPRRAFLEFGFDEHDATDDGALARLVAEAATQAATPGHWSYANIGWCVLGRAIETVTGETWDRAMPELLFRAGLRQTTWTSHLGDRVVGHEDSPDGPVPALPLLNRAYGPAGTSIASTLEDLLRYAVWHLADPAPTSLRAVHADVSIAGWLDGWGLGLARFDWNGLEVWGWDGLVPGQRCVMRLLPDRDGAVVVLANGSAGRAMARGLLADGAPDWFGVDAPGLRLDTPGDEPGQLSSYVGSYGWPDRRVDVTAHAHGLLLTEEGESQQAVRLDQRTFLVDRENPDTPTVTFGGFDADGRPGVLYDMVWGLERLPH